MEARLIYSDSESSADLYYATRFFAPDAFLYLRDATGKSHLVTTALEVDRARRTARVDVVHDWEVVRGAFKGQHPEKTPDESQLMGFFLRQQGVVRAEVPAQFPLGLAEVLKAEGVRVTPVAAPFWPDREFKSLEEVGFIESALAITARGMDAGIALIRRARIGGDGVLELENEPLTSERVRGEINACLVREGAIPHRTIVAGGFQGADPHEEGFGVLLAHHPIILDVFPRVERSGYWGDMTRTVCRGGASDRVRRAWEAVRGAQEVAFGLIRSGISGLEVHEAVMAHVTGAGFVTGLLEDGRQGGFFHGTGHGLGLEIHEAPRIGRKDQTMRVGQVVTVEPGLYYPDMGGVRLEDVVLVQEGGCRNLTVQEKFLEI